MGVWVCRGVGDAHCAAVAVVGGAQMHCLNTFFYMTLMRSRQNLSVSAWIGVSVGV